MTDVKRKSKVQESIKEVKSKTKDIVQILENKDSRITKFILVISHDCNDLDIIDFTYDTSNEKIIEYANGIYSLVKVAGRYLGKPLYIIEQGCNLSVSYDVLNTSKERLIQYIEKKINDDLLPDLDKSYTELIKNHLSEFNDELDKGKNMKNLPVLNNKVLIEKGHTPYDHYNELNSQGMKYIYRPKTRDKFEYILFYMLILILLCILVGLAVYLSAYAQFSQRIIELESQLQNMLLI